MSCARALGGVPYGPVNHRPPSTIPDVVARLRALESSPSRSDGVACFARLYREVTEGVQRSSAGTPSRTADSWNGSTCGSRISSSPRSTSSTGSRRRAACVATVVHAAREERCGAAAIRARRHERAHQPRPAGGAVATCRELGIDLRDGSPEQADYVQVNRVLAVVEARVKRSFVTGWLSLADRLVHRFHRLDDVVAMWDIERARAAAWTNGLALWTLRDDADLSASFLLTLDRMVGLASRGLMIPADTALQKLGRLFGA